MADTATATFKPGDAPTLNKKDVERETRGTPVDDATDDGTVALAEGRDAERVAEGGTHQAPLNDTPSNTSVGVAADE